MCDRRQDSMMMTRQQADLHWFFSDKAKLLQNEIDLEIAKIGRMREVEKERS